ncbi:MAG TPA: hypothetical protein ENI73_06805 [Spirochaetes bacterium]|nr:hypothetical protein [Spirochaetota bacterium]
MRIITLLMSFVLLFGLLSSQNLYSQGNVYHTRYFYQGFYDKEQKKWYFSQPKSMLITEKDGRKKSRPLFRNNETVYVVSYNNEGKIVRILKARHWFRRSGAFGKPLNIYIVDHYNRKGNIVKKATYYHKIGWTYARKIEYYEKGHLIAEEVYRNGKFVSKRDYKKEGL